MRVLMLDNEFPPLGGGTGVVNERLLAELADDADLTVDLITSSRTRSQHEVERFAERIWIYKVPVDNQNIHHSTNGELLRYVRRGLGLALTCCRYARYDLSFAFAGVPAGVMSYALWLRHRLPYIVSLQGPDVPGFEARYAPIYPLLAPLLREVWCRAAAVTAISAQHRDLALQTLPGLAIPVIANGVETDVFTPGDRSMIVSQPRVVCVGRLIERKGQQHLLRAFAALRAEGWEITLTLVGTGDDEARLRRIAAELGVADAVTFAGFTPRAAMPAVYCAADIFVLPSQSEGMSIALLEAMASGLPCVVSDTGGTDELIDHGATGLVTRWADVAGLTAALRTLLADATLRRQMGAAARERARQFSWPQIAAQYRALLDDAIADRPRL